MDVDVPQTSGAEADGQVVSFWLPDAGVKFLRSESFSGTTVANKPGSPRRSRSSRKPLRGEGWVIPVTCGDYARVLYSNSHARLRVHRAPGFPCALIFERVKEFPGKPRA